MLCTQTPATARQQMRGGRESKKMEGKCMCVTDALDGPESQLLQKMCDTQTHSEGFVLSSSSVDPGASSSFLQMKWSYLFFMHLLSQQGTNHCCKIMFLTITLTLLGEFQCYCGWLIQSSSFFLHSKNKRTSRCLQSCDGSSSVIDVIGSYYKSQNALLTFSLRWRCCSIQVHLGTYPIVIDLFVCLFVWHLKWTIWQTCKTHVKMARHFSIAYWKG